MKYLKQVAAILMEKYGGDTPATYDEVVALPGVGQASRLIDSCRKLMDN